jgi:hypothetical protein
MKITGWEFYKKSKFSSIWMKSDGIVGGIGNQTKYPFIAVVKDAVAWQVRLITYSQTIELGAKKTRIEAEKVAVAYMKAHPEG